MMAASRTRVSRTGIVVIIIAALSVATVAIVRVFDHNGRRSATSDGLSVSPQLIARRTTDSPVSSIEFSPNGKMVADRLDNGIIQLRSSSNGQLLSTWNLNLIEGQGAFAFAPDGKDLAVGVPLTPDKTSKVELLNIKTKAVERIIKVNAADIYSLAFSPNGRTLAIAAGTFLVVTDLHSGMSIYAPDRAPNDFIAGVYNPTGEASDVSFSGNGKLLTVGGLLGQVKLWNVAESRFVGGAMLSAKGRGIPSSEYPSVTLDSVAINSDGSAVALAGAVGSGSGNTYQGSGLWLWHSKTGTITSLINDPVTAYEPTGMTGAAFSPKGNLFASGDDTGTIQLRNPGSGKPVSTSYSPAEGDTRVVFSPDGRKLASGEWIQSGSQQSSGALQIWKVYSTQKKESSNVSFNDLMSAPVPAACEHSAGSLAYGEQRDIPEGHGSTELAWLGQGSSARLRLTAFGSLSGNGTHDAATILECDAGGVPWPSIVAFYGPGPTLLGWKYLSAFNLPGKQPGENAPVTKILYDDGGVNVEWSTQDEGDPAAIATLDYSAHLRLSNRKIIASDLTGVTEEQTAKQFVSDLRTGDLTVADKLAAAGQEPSISAVVHDYPSALAGDLKCYGQNDLLTTAPEPISQLASNEPSDGLDRVCALGPVGQSTPWIVLGMQHLGFRHWQVLWISPT